MTDILTRTNSYLQDFAGRDLGVGGSGPAWLRTMRLAAGEQFAEAGFPTRHDEEWRFTNISPIAETPFRRTGPAVPLTIDEVAAFTYAGLTGIQLVFVNGNFQAALSHLGGLQTGLSISSLADTFAAQNQDVEQHLGRYAQFADRPFAALNTAALDDGAFVKIARGVVVEQPIHLLFVSTASDGPSVSHPRTLILAGENSQCTVVETYVGLVNHAYFTNAVTEIVLDPHAMVDHYKVQKESLKSYHIATLQVQVGRNANFSSHSIGLGGLIVRNDANAYMGGEGGECTLNGLCMAGDHQLADSHTAIDHAVPNCNSHEIYKFILDGHARGVFNGKIFVREDAQKTDAKQTNQTLLLSRDAQINTKPQLEIFADDVKCTHGATIGQLSDEALFYLRSRGIPKERAQSLLTYAFASDIVSRIKVDSVRAQLDQALLAEQALEELIS